METTTIFLCVLLLTVLLFLTVFFYVIYSGLLDSVQVGAGKSPIKNVEVAYKFGRGPYRDTGSVFTEVTSIAPKLRCLGIYYDDPNQVPSHKLRWAVGSILSEGEEAPDPDIVAMFERKGFKTFHLPEVSSVVRTSFPDRTMLSVFIGIFKVYPLLGEYVRINKLCAHPWMEVYGGRTISYLAPLARQDEFYVPESLDHGEPEEDEEEKEFRQTMIKEMLEAVPEELDEILLGKRIPFPEEHEPSSSQSTEVHANRDESWVNKSWRLGDVAATFRKKTGRGEDSREVSRGKHSSREDSGVSGCDRHSMNSTAATNGWVPNIRKAQEAALETHRQTNSHSREPATDDTQTEDEQDVSLESTLSEPPASPLSSVASDCSMTDSDRERSVSFYSSQSELSHSSRNRSSQSELSQSDFSQSDLSQSGYSQSGVSQSGVSRSSMSYSSRAPTTEFSSDSDGETETETAALPKKDGGRVS